MVRVRVLNNALKKRHFIKPPSLLQDPQHSIRIFSNARQNQNLAQCERALVSALKSCSSLSFPSQGRQIHSLALKLGFHSNTFIQNTLIDMYAKCGSIFDARLLFQASPVLDHVSCNIMVSGYVRAGQFDNARQLFDIMPGKDCVSYTTMIKGLVQNRCYGEALEVFKDMMFDGVVPNDLTVVNVTSACSRFGQIWNCRMIHALAIKLVVDGLVRVSTNLMNAYCRCSGVWEARRLFDKMPERNLATWNAMLNGYSKTGLVEMARELFERFPDKDVISWGTMIDCYSQLNCVREAFMMYRSMLRTGAGPNEVTTANLISACGRQTAIDDGRQLHGTVVKKGFDCKDFVQTRIIFFYAACGMMDLASLQFEVGVKDHLESWNALIGGFIKNGMTDQARQVFDEMPERDVCSCSTMISGYAQTKQPKMALEIFHKMVASGIKPNEVTMVSVLSAIGTLGTLKEGRWAHGYISSECIPLNDNLRAALIAMYAKCGSIDSALQFFNQIRDEVSSVSPWNAILSGLASHGHASKCLEVFSDLQRYHIRPNLITFIGVLNACYHAGLVERGRRIFKSMKSTYNVEPDIKHYSCMVDLLGRAGLLEEAEEIIRSMPMEADIVIWGALLATCKTHGNVNIGERAAKSLAGLAPSHGGGKVLLSNIYADAGRWEDVSLVRRVMQGQRIERMPGCSGVIR
ncbi:pentatricopeptide repeat-containing protein At5g19020, mitochondrial-like [Lotus japonicus]|uniref:pentatricopeptide repeat-containing protein At5g19020, mitochondrial-like n=1 Tax=Lotus japonicus TaxID=34305 RepID=UPI002583F368|nr:pentatricopeptide repeat-containing protein At5g19020, mitochondrial-like [Lotus japonicus]XP_057429117.1 pentatricopeptide repeat-containing protein At5g19020, mitochondrial-like [Lotus japonicus]